MAVFDPRDGDVTPPLTAEKDISVVVNEGTQSPVPDWSDEEEKRLVRKVDMLVMPLLVAGFFVLQLDRGNIGNALTDFFFRDVGISQNQFNIGQQLLSVGIVLFEIPSNYILYRIGPTLWISGQIIAWGLVATFQAFQKGLASFLITRLLLGIGESGFIPASLYTITKWYKRDETSKRFAIFFLGNMVAGASSGLIAYGILQMRGICGLAGWQWLFIIEGILTVVIGICFTLFFPRSTADPVCLFGIRYFDEREAHILTQRVLLDDPSKVHRRKNITWGEIKAALLNWRLYPHVLFTIGGIAPASTMMSYAPTLVASYGYERLRSNAMVSIGAWIQLVLNILWGFLADKFGHRGILVSVAMCLWWAFALGSRLVIDSTDAGKRFALLTLALSFSTIWHPVNSSWVSLNARSAGERSITLAIIIMSANCSGIVGSQLFQQSDRPLYRVGWSAIVGLLSMALFFTIWANVQYRVLNRRQKKKGLLNEQTRYLY